ncbi:MAG TPA: phage tail tape measure protein [Mesorhizobium sp.]|jgi:phage-related minor tail protein|nr:phage tail tape measure protein [Mesorhizobium sp.]
MDEDVTVRVTADTAPFQAALNDLSRLADGFGRQLSGALKSAAVGGQELDDVLKRLALNLAGMALGQGLKPVENLASGLFAKLLGGLAGGAAPVIHFAKGGVVSSPTFFPAGGAVGLMGEAGPEAVMPLRRGPDGSLGVASGGGGAPVQVVFNVSTPDAASFRKSEAQVTGMLARAVSRGARTL